MTEPDEIVFLSQRWEHPEKKRYYHVVMSKDLFGDWVITKAWGGMNKAIGKVTNIAYPSCADAKRIVNEIAKVRVKRGYVLKLNRT